MWYIQSDHVIYASTNHHWHFDHVTLPLWISNWFKISFLRQWRFDCDYYVSLSYLFYFCDFHNTPFPPNLRYLLIYMYWCYRGINVHLCFISVWMWLLLIYFGLFKCVNKRNTSIGSASAITDISYTGIFFLLKWKLGLPPKNIIWP